MLFMHLSFLREIFIPRMQLREWSLLKLRLAGIGNLDFSIFGNLCCVRNYYHGNLHE